MVIYSDPTPSSFKEYLHSKVVVPIRYSPLKHFGWGFFCSSGKKEPSYAVLDNFRSFMVFTCNLINF